MGGPGAHGGPRGTIHTHTAEHSRNPQCCMCNHEQLNNVCHTIRVRVCKYILTRCSSVACLHCAYTYNLYAYTCLDSSNSVLTPILTESVISVIIIAIVIYPADIFGLYTASSCERSLHALCLSLWPATYISSTHAQPQIPSQLPACHMSAPCDATLSTSI